MTDLSEFSPVRCLALAIEDFERTGDTDQIAAFLEGDSPINRDDREALASLVRRGLKRLKGRPPVDPAETWFRSLTAPTKIAARFAQRYAEVLRYRRAKGRPIPPGPMMQTAARLACSCLERRSGGRMNASPDAVRELLRRPKSRL